MLQALAADIKTSGANLRLGIKPMNESNKTTYSKYQFAHFSDRFLERKRNVIATVALPGIDGDEDAAGRRTVASAIG